MELHEVAAETQDQGHEGGSRTGKYTILETLNWGSSGVVNLVCLSRNLKQKFACKNLRLEEGRSAKILKEVDLIRKASHKHVVRIVDAFADARGRFQIVMAPAADCDLSGYLRDQIPEARLAGWDSFGRQRVILFQWMYCLITAVEHMHGSDIRHRDLKPDNILVYNDRILITDFGISFHSNQGTEYTNTPTLGTPKYLPPEADDKRRCGKAGDIFSLGCVFWEMADALSDPILSTNSKFPREIKRYSDLVRNYENGDDNFLSKVTQIQEHKRMKKRLPEHCRLRNSFGTLLLLIYNMMNPSPDERPTAKQLNMRFDGVIREAECPALPCCFHLGHLSENQALDDILNDFDSNRQDP
ncbi:hypothetical protein ABKA04_009599 [Annulohypoxylon sp. FPYF3050]